VQGLIEVLRARTEFRNQFRLPVTRVRTTENNPLKFAINAEDALGSLLGRRNPGYMPATEAFDDAFDDVRFHQLAMIAGMRAGFEGMMNRFDPQKLQERFDRQLKTGGFLAMAAKLRYWDLYTDLFDEMAGNQDAAFQRLFGEEFASAYEKQLEALKRSRGNPRH
jgi:type VI secretion system protein ImpI